MNQESYTVLLVSQDDKVTSQIKAFLASPMFELSHTENFYEASRLSESRQFDIIIADSNDGYETDFAINISDTDSTILLLVPSEHFDQITYNVERYGILTITKPFEPFYFYNMIKIAIAVQYKVKALSTQTIKLKSKMEEIRLVNRAKLLLVEKRGMTEADAHHYLEKHAMDNGLKRITVAENVIKEYE